MCAKPRLTWVLLIAPWLALAGCSGDGGGSEGGGVGRDLGPWSDAGPVEDAGVLDSGPEDGGSWPDLAAYQEQRPRISGVSPQEGLADGGDRVEIFGEGFVFATEVLFGEARSEFQVVGPDRIVATTPPGDVGPVDVVVRTVRGVAVLGQGFTYRRDLLISSVDPPALPTTGGTRITIYGAGFLGGPPDLYLGRGRVWGVQVIDDSRLEAVAPPNPEGPADLWAFRGGESSTVRAAVTYLPPPRVGSVTPWSGPVEGGTPVEVRGVGLGPDPEVHLGITRVAPAVAQDHGALRFVTPPAAQPGPVDLLIRTPVGEVVVQDGFVYTGDSPGVYSLQPPRGPVEGGDRVTLVGVGLDRVEEVLFGAKAADCSLTDPGHVACVVPPGDAPGPVDVVAKLGRFGISRLTYTYVRVPEVLRVAPRSGPEDGGTAVEIHGTGFAAGARVYFGPAPASLVVVRSPGLITCVTPPGSAGPVDVTVVQEGERSTLRDGFSYSGPTRVLALDPPAGSMAGGTLVRLIGRGLRPGVRVMFGGRPATDLTWVGPELITMRTPPADQEGPVDVQIPGQALLPAAFTYFDPFNGAGGVWGGAIQGSINVAVRDSYTGEPVPDALVAIGPGLAPEDIAHTDSRGMVTISREGLRGPVDLHVGHPLFEPASFLHTDGRNATFFLIPRKPPTSTGSGPGEQPEVDGTISGILSGLDKYVIEPQDGQWEKVAFVETTREGIFGGNPYPGEGGEVHEDGPYTITSRPGDLAVVAVGGLRNRETNEFIPLRMGVHRYLFMPLGGTLEGVDVRLDIRLDRRAAITLDDPPYDMDDGPDSLGLSTWIELDPEGFYPMKNKVEGYLREFWLEHLPEAHSPSLEGVKMHIQAGLYTQGSRPYTMVWVGDVPLDVSELTIGPFVGIPRLVTPSPVRSLGEDYLFRWEIPGGADPDVYSLRILGPDLGPAWRIVLPGPGAREFTLPKLEGIFEIPEGRCFMSITAGLAPAFDMSAFEYRHLSVRAWDGWSVRYADFLNSPTY